MTEWLPEVVCIGDVSPHPNRNSADPNLKCDTLSITHVHDGYPVLFRDGEFKKGDLAAYLPIETVVPENHPLFAFLGDRRRIKAKRIRGVFSMGVLVPAPKDFEIGQSVVEHFGLEKYEPAEERFKMAHGTNVPGPSGWEFPRYTDVEALRRYKTVLDIDEQVVITEKIHGQNGRFCYDDEKKLWVGSRTMIKKRDGAINWWYVVNKLDLEEKFAKYPFTVFFGEVYGKSVQNLTYGLQDEKSLRIFDTLDAKAGKYNDWDRTVEIAKDIGLEVVPELYRGLWKGFDAHASLAEGQSTIANHVREGFVVKPLKERYVHRCGRVIFKHIGEGYLLRDEKKKE